MVRELEISGCWLCPSSSCQVTAFRLPTRQEVPFFSSSALSLTSLQKSSYLFTYCSSDLCCSMASSCHLHTWFIIFSIWSEYRGWRLCRCKVLVTFLMRPICGSWTFFAGALKTKGDLILAYNLLYGIHDLPRDFFFTPAPEHEQRTRSEALSSKILA